MILEQSAGTRSVSLYISVSILHRNTFSLLAGREICDAADGVQCDDVLVRCAFSRNLHTSRRWIYLGFVFFTAAHVIYTALESGDYGEFIVEIVLNKVDLNQ